MKAIKIVGKKFKLASRLTRLYALFIDIAILGAVQSVFGTSFYRLQRFCFSETDLSICLGE